MLDPKETIEAARIPLVGRDVRLQDCDGARPLINYVNGQQFKDDLKAGIGGILTGPPGLRRKTFMAFARGVQLLTNTALYTNLQNLMLAVTVDNHPMFELVSGAKGLFVTGMFDSSIPTPLTGQERMYVENFLRERSDNRMRNYYSLSDPMLRAEWWSMDFRAHQAEVCRSFEVL